MKTSEITINTFTFTINKVSKWTIAAYDKDNKKVATAPSMPKLKAKLNELFPTPVIEKPKAEKKISMRQITLDMILADYSDEEVLEAIKTRFPDAKYDNSHVKWYRSNFAKAELTPPRCAPKRSQAYKEWFAKEQAKAVM